MAGIAFRLQKLLSGESYSDLVRAYLFSGVISTGPFIVVITTIACIKAALQFRLSIEEGHLLMSLIVYVFAFSMLGVSPFYYVVTRYLADKYFFKQIDAFSSSYLSVLYVIFLLQTITAGPYLLYLDLNANAKWVLYCLYLMVSGIWIAMIYLSAARSYLWIVTAFSIGAVVGIAASLLMGYQRGFNGFINGFALGQAVCFFILTLRIFNEFGYTTAYNFDFFSYFKKHPNLILIGVAYYLGIWIDKFIFWFSPAGDRIAKGIYVFMNYDTPIFLAFITVIPSMAFFLVQMETSFVKYYHTYFESVRKRGSLKEIRENHIAMTGNLSEHFQKYAILQGLVSGIVVIFIYEIANAFSLNPYQMGIFRICILGAFLQMGFLMILNIIFYFDFQKDALRLTVIFLVTNAVFTRVTMALGYETYGFGYTAACFITILMSFLILNHKLKHLEYWVFMTQPVIIPKFKLESETHKKTSPDKKLKKVSTILR
ncbi:MAG: exopolysaccharide Pel transporter PelG [Deltaproteobacteria bacterium]|nr:exopolysaccharide Pel transporter PelG [Deltaproteobacteria bacterium]